MERQQIKKVLEVFSKHTNLIQLDDSFNASLECLSPDIEQQLKRVYDSLTKVVPMDYKLWLQKHSYYPFFRFLLEYHPKDVMIVIYNKYNLFWKYRDEDFFNLIFDAPVLLGVEFEPRTEITHKMFTDYFVKLYKDYFGKRYIYYPNKPATFSYVKRYFMIDNFSFLDILCLLFVYFQAIKKQKLKITPTIQSFVRYVSDQNMIDNLLKKRFDTKLFSFSEYLFPSDAMRVFVVLLQFLKPIYAYQLTKAIANVKDGNTLTEKIQRCLVILGTCIGEVIESGGEFYIYKGILFTKDYLGL